MNRARSNRSTDIETFIYQRSPQLYIKGSENALLNSKMHCNVLLIENALLYLLNVPLKCSIDRTLLSLICTTCTSMRNSKSKNVLLKKILEIPVYLLHF